MDWLKRLFRRPEPDTAPMAPTLLADLQAATLDELIGESQRLGTEGDAIRERRKLLRAEIDRRHADGQAHSADAAVIAGQTLDVGTEG